MAKRKILVLGAGFGGVYVAKRLIPRLPPDAEIEIVDDNNYFVFQPLLPEVAGGSINAADAVTPLRLLLPGVKTSEAEIVAIDLVGKRVEVVQGMRRSLRVIPYDQLVIALGQVVDLRRYPGLQEHALRMKDLADAFRLRNHLIDCLEQADIAENPDLKRRLLTFVVIGGGLSGVETVGEMQNMIARALPFYPRINHTEVHVSLVEYQPRILPEVADKLADYAVRQLRRRGIEVITGAGVKSAAIDSVELTDGRVLRTMTMVATVGNGPSPLVDGLPVAKQRGRIVTDRCLRVPGADAVWALGDSAWTPAGGGDDPPPTPPTAQAAVQQADTLAGNLAATLSGTAPSPFTYRSRGQLASLGGRRGVADVFGFELAGFLAWVLWRSFYLAMLPGWTTKVRVAVDWTLDAVFPRNIVEIQQPAPRAVRRQHFRPGDLVYRDGEVTGPLYIVLEGSFERIDAAGRAVFRRGSRFGAGALRGERLRRATVQACEPSVCLVVERADLEEWGECLDGLRHDLEELRMGRLKAAGH